MGSRRFGAFIVYVSILSTITELIIFNIFFGVERYSGPYPQLGAVLSLYHRFTPRLYPKFFGILGYDLSEKSLVYALCAQVIFSGGWSTFVPALVGFGSGMLCVSVSEHELPEFVYTMCKYSGSSIVDEGEKLPMHSVSPSISFSSLKNSRTANSAPAIMMARSVQRGAERGNRQQRPPAGGNGVALVAPRPPPPPSEEVIAQLTSMGFDRQAVIRALQQTDNNVEGAANRLLMG